jgi:hypothetical protein
MNLQLAESLATVVVALQTEDYALFQDALISKMIRKMPGVAGGCACIRPLAWHPKLLSKSAEMKSKRSTTLGSNHPLC